MFWYKYALTLHRKYCIKHTYAKKVLFVGNSNLSILYFIWPYPQISCCSSLLCIFFFVFVTNTLCCCYLVTQSCPTLCHPMDCNTLGLPVLHCLLELAQTHVHLISDVKQSFYPLSSPSPPAFNLFQLRIFSMSQFFISGGQSIGASASASVLPKNTED